MGVDSSPGSFAFCLFDGKPIKWGKVVFNGNDIYEKVVDCRNKMKFIKQEVSPDYICVESAIMVKSQAVAINMAMIVGSIISELAVDSKSIITVPPASWQNYIGNKNLTKQEKEEIKLNNPQNRREVEKTLRMVYPGARHHFDDNPTVYAFLAINSKYGKAIRNKLGLDYAAYDDGVGGVSISITEPPIELPPEEEAVDEIPMEQPMPMEQPPMAGGAPPDMGMGGGMPPMPGGGPSGMDLGIGPEPMAQDESGIPPQPGQPGQPQGAPGSAALGIVDGEGDEGLAI